MNQISPQTILSLARNFMESRILLTGAELDLFTLLGPAPLPAQEVAVKIHADLRALTTLLDALTAMGLLVKKEEGYQCPPSISLALTAETPDSVLPMILHMADLWRRWSDLTRVVQGASLSKKRRTSQEARQLQAFIGAMHVIASPLAARVVAAVVPGSSRALLDVGGGSGIYSMAFLQAASAMRATLFDRPAVIEIAQQHLRRAGLLDRVTLVPGDFYRDELPPGHDLAFLSAIIHQNSPEQNLDLFLKVFRSLNPGGRMVIRDHVMSEDRTYPRDGAIFAVNMLLGTSGGNTYTFEEIKEGLQEAGFSSIRLLQKGEHMDGLVEAFKP
jgi:predicted O-methyltransferase YrrM